MGLFDKKFCCICGKKAGMLSRTKIKDGKYLCGDCEDKCSADWLSDKDDDVSEGQVKKNIAYMKKNNKVLKNDFNETDSFELVGEYGDDDECFKYDTEHGWWVHNDEKTIYRFSDVKSWRFHLETSDLDEDEDDEDDDDDDGSLLDDILDVVDAVADAIDEASLRDDLEPCPDGQKIDEMYIVVKLNSPWAKKVRITTLEQDEHDSNREARGYKISAKIMDLLEKYQDSESAVVVEEEAK